MHDEREILQERIEVAAFGRRGHQAREWIRGRQHEELEPDADEPEEAEHAAPERRIQRAARCRHGEGPAREAQRPQQQRAFVRAPDRGDAVENGQFRMRVRRHVKHGKILLDEGPGQRAEGEGDEDELPDDGGAAGCHPRRIAARRAAEAEGGLRRRQQERQDQREMAQLRDHSDTRAGWGRAATPRLRAACSSRRASRAPRPRRTPRPRSCGRAR